MPKVSRKESALPLQEAVQMDIEHGVLPDKPGFAPLAAGEEQQKVQFRRIPVPQHRLTPLKTSWMQLYEPITKNLKLDMRMNLKTKKVRRGTRVSSAWHHATLHHATLQCIVGLLVRAEGNLIPIVSLIPPVQCAD